MATSSSGLGCWPFKPVTAVQIRSSLPCPRNLMDRNAVYETAGGGSTPLGGAKEKEVLMSRSNKARYGTKCKHWKDTVYASRPQVRAYTKKKRRAARSERRTSKQVLPLMVIEDQGED